MTADSTRQLRAQLRVLRESAALRPSREGDRLPDRVGDRLRNREADRRPGPEERRRSTSPEPPPWLQGCLTGPAHAAEEHPNGQVPTTDLCRLPGGAHLLHGDAALAWWRLDRAFARHFGTGVCMTDSYRSYEAQAQLYALKPGLAAVPGTSNHGWGVALDLCGGVESYDTPAHEWMRRHGHRYGWVNPPWAQRFGTLPEPWHWEYVGTARPHS